MQAARKRVGRITGFFVKFSARMQAGERQHYNRNFLVGMLADRDAATVVGDGDGAIQMQRHVNAFGKAAECFIGRVVDDFLNDVGG